MKLILTLLFALSITSPALAQSFFDTLGQDGGVGEDMLGTQGPSVINQYDKKYKPTSGAQVVSGGLLPSGHSQLYFARTTDTPKDYATLRFAQEVSLSGCAQIIQAPTEIKKHGKSLSVTLPVPDVKVDHSIRNAISGCDQSGQTPIVEIKLSHKDIASGKTNKLILKSPASSHIYALHTSKHAIHATPDNGGKALTYWMYPDNLIILNAPSARDISVDGATLRANIKKMAYSHGLIPATELLEGFNPPADGYSAHYFIDPSKKLASILSQSEQQFVDTITLQEQFLGSKGAYEVPREVQVFARKPGLYD